MKQALTSALDLAAGTSVVIGASMLASWLGWIVAGALGLLFSWRIAQ